MEHRIAQAAVWPCCGGSSFGSRWGGGGRQQTDAAEGTGIEGYKHQGTQTENREEQVAGKEGVGIKPLVSLSFTPLP